MMERRKEISIEQNQKLIERNQFCFGFFMTNKSELNNLNKVAGLMSSLITLKFKF